MNWESLDAFLAMGGHGFYVWGSYAVTFVLLALEAVWLGKARRDAVRELKRGSGSPA